MMIYNKKQCAITIILLQKFIQILRQLITSIIKLTFVASKMSIIYLTTKNS